MMDKSKKIYCIIPALNEEKNIYTVIKEVLPLVDKLIIVDDGSTDKTFEIASKTDAIVLKHIINRGQGAALRTGNDYALLKGADIVVHFDADRQFLSSEIKDVIAPIINDECDVIFGSRFLTKKSNIPWFKEKVIFPIAKLVNLFLLGVNLSDPQAGFRAMSRRALLKIKIQNDGSAHCSEIMYKVFKYKLKFSEVPITVVYNNFGKNILTGKGRASGGVKIVKDLIITKFIE